MNAYYGPVALEDALRRLAEAPHTVLAGGTDLYPADAHRRGWGEVSLSVESARPVLDISNVDGLDQIEVDPHTVTIGARVTWSEAVASKLGGWFDSVRKAAVKVGGPQVQNRGTLVGNVCNASPAADGVPALLALDASVRVQRLGATRDIPLGKFITGNRKTILGADELVSAIVIPVPAAGTISTFLKLGARRHLVISIAMVAATVRTDGNRISGAAIAVGACSPVAVRLADLEKRLVGVSLTDASAEIRATDAQHLAAIDDIRASGAYRHGAALELTRRALRDIAAQAEGGL